MARLKQGILGPFHGTIGTAVGYELHGEGIIRSKPRIDKNRKLTGLELTNRMWFKQLQHFLQPLTPFLRIGFKNYAEKYSGFNAAKSYNSKVCRTGEYPNIVVNPAKALVSFGHLNPSDQASAICERPHIITLRWSGGEQTNQEKAMILLYDTENRRAFFDTAATWRWKEEFDFELPTEFAGRRFHVYLAFVAFDQSNQSNSQYLGEVLLS